MAPRRTQQSSQNEHVYALGVRGRKTGVTLEDKGERDEYGMEPADGLFSSPGKESNGRPTPRAPSLSDDEQDMELDEAYTPGPATVSRLRRDRLSIPKARSPAKTFLNSPARQNPHVARLSSPIRGSFIDEEERNSPDKSAKRRLNFSLDPRMKPTTNGHSTLNGTSQSRTANSNTSDNSEDEDEASILHGRNTRPTEADEDDEEDQMDFLDAGDEDLEPPADDEDQDEEESVEAEILPKKRGRKPKASQDEELRHLPAPKNEGLKVKKRGPKAKNYEYEEDPEPVPPSPKRRRGRSSLDNDDDEAAEEAAAEERATKRSKTSAPTAKPKQAGAKGKPGRKRKSSGVGVDSPAILPRPPMPKQRGLQIMRKDMNLTTTRSGRLSTKPLEFWRGERYDYEDDEEELLEDSNGRRIKVGTKIKGVVRVDYNEPEPKAKRRGGGKAGSGAGRSRRRVSDIEEDEDREEWETESGRVTGECIYWYPEYEFNPPQDDDQVEVTEEELAISSKAIQTKEIKDATFRFAKTMTVPFFGSGVVDLPPHSEKRTKNSRKMQMVFFIHYGNVEVTVAQTTFRIGKGGTWFVPRGNHYSIVNDTGRPARLFFCQGCEVLVPAESQEM
ncbi:kinetochore CENP-C fungal-like protein [Xylariales sp. PMI_506]|nr:kinetochore CENP-C fungal-like protein [Xylariales sp. PMI_506]